MSVNFIRPLLMVFLIIFTISCSAPVGNKMVRVLFPNGGNYAEDMENKETVHRVQDVQLMGLIRELKPGDIVLVDGNNGMINELAEVCKKNGVSLYFHPRGFKLNVFNVDVFTWVTPFDTPTDLSSASFYHDGNLIGHGDSGFRKMLKTIEASRAGTPLILGCHVRDPLLSGTLEPFAQYEDMLNKALNSHRIYLMDMTQF
jgi:hypothetical protein